MSTDKKKSRQISRREFSKDVGLIFGGAAIGSMAILGTQTKSTTITAPGGSGTSIVTATSGQVAKVATLSEALRNKVNKRVSAATTVQ